ncbi:MAG: hypothetical protein ACRC9L_08745 [Brevinema sp.]
MPLYEDSTLLLYLEKKLPPNLMEEISSTLCKDIELLAHLMDIIKAIANNDSHQSEIHITKIKGKDTTFTSGNVNLVRRDDVHLRGMDHSMIHSILESEELRIGITRTGKSYLLQLSGATSCILETPPNFKHLTLDEGGKFIQISSGIHRLYHKKEIITLTLE